MAWTIQLLNDDITLNLNDGSAYSARPGFLAPPPPVRVAQGGANLFRHGSDIRERVYANRSVTVTLRIHGTSQDNLIANILALNDLLERAAEFTTTGLGSQVKLRRKWEGATNQVDFHVLTGTLALGDEFSPVHSQNTSFPNAVLRLTCEPFAYGAEETIENYVADPGFEILGTALTDWTQNHTGSGTSASDTSVAKDGKASLKLVMTSSSSGQVIERYQVLADVDAAEVWSFQCWVRVDALSDCKVVMGLDYNTGTDVEVSSTTVSSEFVKLTANNNTVPGSVTQVTLRIRLEATDASATGTVYIDNVIAVLASAVPVAWVSSHSTANHYVDGTGDSQATTNYIDIHDVPGDIPALLQVKITELSGSHDEFWAGARHAGRQYDGSIILEAVSSGHSATNTPSGFTATLSNVSDAVYSDGTARRMDLERTTAGTATLAVGSYSKHTFTISSPPTGQFRVLVSAQAFNGVGASGTYTFDANKFSWGLNYSYGDFDLLDTTSPDATSFVALPSETLGVSSSSAFNLLDLGTITIPPIGTPDNQTAASLVLIIHQYFNTAQQISYQQEIQMLTDFVMLMPVDYGANYVSKPDATDVILLDSMSDTKGLYLLDTSDVVQSFPSNQLGRSPEAHPDGTRIYMLAQNGTYTKTDTFTVSVTYRPRFLHVMGA